MILRAAVAVLFVAATADAADTVYLKPLFTAATLAPTPQHGLGVGVPVTIEPAKPPIDFTALRVDTADVMASGGVHPLALKSCFIVSKATPSQTSKELDVTTDPSEICTMALHPGLYVVTIAVTPIIGAAKPGTPEPATQLLPLQLTVPTAEMRPLVAQTVEQVWYWPWKTPETRSATLRLFNTSRTSSLGPVTVMQADPSVADDGEINEHLEFKTKPCLGPATNAEIPITLTGLFPKGKTKTTVQISAPQLASNVYVAYEIRARFHPWLVVPAIFVGLCLGFLIRVVLTRIIARNNARIAALDTVKKIEGARGRSADKTFREETTVIVNDLRAAIADRGAEAKLPEATTDAETKLAAAVHALQTRLSEVMGAIEALSQQLGSTARLPESVATIVEESRSAIDDLKKEVYRGDASGATEDLDRLREKIVQRAGDAAADWRNEVREALNALERQPAEGPKFPAGFTTLLANQLLTVRNQLSLIQAGTQPPPELSALLASVANARYSVETEMNRQVLAQLAAYADSIAKILAAAQKDAQPIADAAQKLRNAIADDSSAKLTAPVEATGELLDVMRATISSLAPESMREKLAETMDKGEYKKAAQAVASGQGVALGGAEAAATMVAVEAPAVVAQSAVFRLLPPPPVAVEIPFATQRLISWAELLLSKATQFVVTTLGVTLIGAIALVPTFDGTWRGLALAFFWGYAGDFTADALTDAARKLRS
jgi:hypothetical protein